jgi:hypothetical protein
MELEASRSSHEKKEKEKKNEKKVELLAEPCSGGIPEMWS